MSWWRTRAKGRSGATGSSGPTGGPRAPRSSTGRTRPAWCRWRIGLRTGSSAGPGWPGGGDGTCWRSTTRAARTSWPGCVTTAPSRRTSWVARRRADHGGIGPRPRSPRSGCWTSASWSAASDEASSASTTWPSAPCRRTCWPRTGPTMSARGGSLLPPGHHSAWRPRPTWPCTTGCHDHSSGGRCRPRTSSRSQWRAGRSAPTPIPMRWHLSPRGLGAGPCSSHPSIPSSGTASGSSGSSVCAIDSRRTPRKRSGCTATSPCPCSRARGSWGWWTRDGGTTRSWPSR